MLGLVQSDRSIQMRIKNIIMKIIIIVWENQSGFSRVPQKSLSTKTLNFAAAPGPLWGQQKCTPYAYVNICYHTICMHICIHLSPSLYIYICMYVYIYIYIVSLYIYIYIYRGKLLHTRNRHLKTHRGFSVACSNECSVAFSNIISLLSGVSQRIASFPVDFHWKCPMDFGGIFR